MQEIINKKQKDDERRIKENAKVKQKEEFEKYQREQK